MKLGYSILTPLPLKKVHPLPKCDPILIKTIFSQHYLGMLSHLFRLFWTNGSYEEDFQRFLSFLVQKIYSIPFGSPTYPEARDGTNIGWTLPEDVSANVSAFLVKWFFRKALNNLFIPFVKKSPPPNCGPIPTLWDHDLTKWTTLRENVST